MVNAISGKGWIPKWEAKVVMAAVTKAQTLNSNKALILCIAGGQHCDAEMARQPALVRAIKTEMASQELRSVSSRKDIRTSSQRLQSIRRRTEIPKTGREEKTRKMGREAKKGKTEDTNKVASKEGKEVEAEKRKYKWVSGEPE